MPLDPVGRRPGDGGGGETHTAAALRHAAEPLTAAAREREAARQIANACGSLFQLFFFFSARALPVLKKPPDAIDASSETGWAAIISRFRYGTQWLAHEGLLFVGGVESPPAWPNEHWPLNIHHSTSWRASKGLQSWHYLSSS